MPGAAGRRAGRKASGSRRARSRPAARPGGVVAAGEDRPAGGGTPREQVDPGDRVAVPVVAGGQPGHQVVEVRGAFGVHAHQGRLHRLQLQGRGEDHPGQSHAAGRGVEQVGAGAHGLHGAVGGEQLHRQHVAGEGAGAVVVLAVDVRADRAADRDVAGAGGHRHEPAERQQDLHQPVQGDPGAAQHGAAVGVDRVHAVQAGHVEHGTARVLRGVAVRPSQPPRDAAARPARADGGHGLLVRPRADQTGDGGGGAAPPGDGSGLGRHVGDRIADLRAISRETYRSTRNG